MEEPLKIMAATQGTFILNDSTEIVGKFDGFVVLEDTIFESITQGVTDVTSEYISNFGKAVKLGAIIRPKNPAGTQVPNKFDKVKLISGSIAVIL
jgi:hypothetical protein